MGACEGASGHYFSLEYVFWRGPAYANLELVEKQDANAGPREAAEICEGPGLGAVLEEEYAAGITVGRFM